MVCRGAGRVGPAVAALRGDEPMTIQVRCPCGKTLRVGDEARGKKVRCPACQAISPVGDPDERSPQVAPSPRRRPAAEEAEPRPDEVRTSKAPARARQEDVESPEERPRRRPAAEAGPADRPAAK